MNEVQKIDRKRAKPLKLVNFRLAVILFILAAISCVTVFYCGVYALFLNIPLLFFAIVYSICLLCKEKPLLHFILFIILSLLVVNTCILQFMLQRNSYNQDVGSLESVTVQGRVVEIAEYSSFNKTLLVKSEQIKTANQSSIKNAYIKVTVQGSSSFKIGDSITFIGNLEKYLFTNTSNLTNFIENIQYQTTIKATAIAYLPNSTFNLFIYIRQRIYTLLFDNFDSEVAGFAYAMLTGDNNFLEKESLQNIRYAGIAHIFAISGLHIGILYSILNKILQKFKFSKWIKLIILASTLLLYGGVCRFSASTLRAILMAIMAVATRYCFRKRDAFTSLSLSGLILLLLKPAYLLSVGFQLSMVAVFAITVVARHFVRLCQVKNKVLQKILQAVIVPATVQVATFPFLLNYFGYASVLSLLLNILVVPLISAVFCLLFIAILLALCIAPIAKIVLFIPMQLLYYILQPLTLFSFNILLISGFSFGVGAVVAWVLMLFILSDKVNLPVVVKIITVLLIFSAIVFIVLLQTAIPNKQIQLIMAQYYESRVVLIKENSKTFLFTNTRLSTAFLTDLFLRQHVRTIDSLFLFSEDSKYINTTVPIVNRLAPVNTVYTLNQDINQLFSGIEIKSMQKGFAFGSFTGKLVGQGALQLESATTSILLVYLAEPMLYPATNILIANSYSTTLNELVLKEHAYYFTSANEEVHENLLNTIDTKILVIPKG